MASTYERALAYLEKMDPAVSGSGGHNQTLRAACECVRFGLSESEAWDALQWWNDHRCQPRWKDHELRHKLASAQRMAGAQAGRRVGSTVPAPRHHARKVWVAPAPPVRPVVKAVVPVYQRSEAEEEAWWSQVAAGRGLTLEQFDIACGIEPARAEEVFVHG